MYCQRDPAWAGIVLGSGPGNITIGTNGCYLTADADLLTWTGHAMNPQQLNDYYIQHGIYVAGDELQDTALDTAFPSLWQDAGVYHCESVPCDQNQLNNDDPNLYVIVELTSPDGSGTHFAPVTQWRTWTVADPWTGQELTVQQVGAMFGWGVDPARLVSKVVHIRYIGGSPAPAPAPPPGTFQGTITAGGAHVRTLPGTDQPIVQQPPPGDPNIVNGGVVLDFNGWCHHTPHGGGDTMPMDTGFNPPRADDRWFLTTSNHWIASVGVDYQNGADPPANLLVADPNPAPAPAPPPAPPPPPPPPAHPVNKTLPAEMLGVVVWETTPENAPGVFGGPQADYGWLKANGVNTVLIRGRNGDGTGKYDAGFEQAWTARAAAARSAGLAPVLWTYWYGTSEGVTGDVATYLAGCADYTAKVTDTSCYVIDAEDRNLPGLGAALLRLAQATGKPVLVTTFGDPKTAGLTWDWTSVDAAVAAYEPQMYTGAWGASPTFQSAAAEWPTPHAPFLPANDETDPTRVAQFVADAKLIGSKGVSFWYYKDATSQAVIKAYVSAWNAPATPPPPPPPPPPTPTPTPTPAPVPTPVEQQELTLLQKILDLVQPILTLLQKIAAALHIA